MLAPHGALIGTEFQAYTKYLEAHVDTAGAWGCYFHSLLDGWPQTMGVLSTVHTLHQCSVQ